MSVTDPEKGVSDEPLSAASADELVALDAGADPVLLTPEAALETARALERAARAAIKRRRGKSDGEDG
jgi:hypothetical protein